MKKFILFTAIFNLIFIAACSSAPTHTIDMANVNAPNTNSEVAQEVNTNLIPMKGLKTVDANGNQLNPTIQANGNKNIKPVSNAVPAPFDSTVATTMNKDSQFLETRVFRSDPLIQKVERLQEIKKVKVYLKNGKVVEAPYDKGSMLFTSGSPQDILSAAGIKPPTQAPAVNPGKIEEATKDAVKKMQ